MGAGLCTCPWGRFSLGSNQMSVLRRLLWPIHSDSSVWFSETPCVFISFPSFLRSLQRRAEKTISHKKATRYISSCLYEPLSLIEHHRRRNTEQNSRFSVVDRDAWRPDDDSSHRVAWTQSGKVTPFADTDLHVQTPASHRPQPWGVFFLFQV